MVHGAYQPLGVTAGTPQATTAPGASGPWQDHLLYSTGEPPDRNRLGDINGDGRLDAVIGYEAINVAGKLAWYEQPEDAGESWVEHIIAYPIGPMSMDAGDMDGDGDLDVIVGEHNYANPEAARLLVFENPAGDGDEWAQHLVYTGDEHHDGAQLVDIDNDHDFDTISIGWQHDRVLLYENTSHCAPAQPTPTPGGPTRTPVPLAQEQVVYWRDTPVYKSEHGFAVQKPPMFNGDWTVPPNFAGGTLYFRAEIISQPVAQAMKLQLCYWQDKYAIENCGSLKGITGRPGNVAEWTQAIPAMWKLNGVPINWALPRYQAAMVVKNSDGLPVSDYEDWNWNGEDPAQWYPLHVKFIAVVVAEGATFGGWERYINPGAPTSTPMPTAAVTSTPTPVGATATSHANRSGVRS